MQIRELKFNEEGSVKDAHAVLYFLDDSEKWPIHERGMVVVFPGGGYTFTSDREAEPVAMRFLAKGYHAAVLRYSCAPAVYPTAMLEAGKLVSWIRENAAEYHVDSQKIYVLGFSAGAHAAGSYCENWNGLVKERLGVDGEMLKPNGMILSYPVITGYEYAHQGSVGELFGKTYEEVSEEEKELFSLEKHVNEDVPPAFLWHTAEDESVPVMNSILMVEALVKHHIPVEYHIFEKGPHGISLADELTDRLQGGSNIPDDQCWVDLALRFLERRREDLV